MQPALGLKEVRRKEAPDGSWKLVYLGDGKSDFTLELTWLRVRKSPTTLAKRIPSCFSGRGFRCGTSKAQGNGLHLL